MTSTPPPGAPGGGPRIKTILLVDDERNITELLKVVLSGEGYRVVSAPNGLEAVKTVEKEIPDLVILDVNMPKMDGWDVLAYLRSHGRTRDLPVLICTNNDLVGDVEKAETLGANGYLTKPFQLDMVVRKVRGLLDGPARR